MNVFTFLIERTVASLEALPIQPEPDWYHVAPSGAGFSIDAPGSQRTDDRPGTYSYRTSSWQLSVQVVPHQGLTLTDVRAGEPHALERRLRLELESMFRVWHPRRHGEPTGGTRDGHLALEYWFEDTQFHGLNLLVVTRERLYNVLAVCPLGWRKRGGERFLRSFRIVTPGAAFR